MRSLVVAVLLALAVATASAQPRSYERTIRQAVAEFDAGHWAEARALFEEAHAIAPSARTLRGLGMCAFELREYAEAVRALRASLESTERPLTRLQREQVEDLLARARAFIGRFNVVVEPAWASLRVDDAEPRFADDGAVVLELGEHVLEASLEGFEPIRRRLLVRGNEEEQVVLHLEPRAPAASSSTRSLPIAPIAFWIAAGGTLLVDAWAIGWIIDRQSELDWCDVNGAACRNRGTLGDQRDASIVTTVALGVSAIGLGVVGLVLWLLEGPRPAASACAPRSLGVACRF